MIIQGSLRHSPSGRKRKTNAWKKAKPLEFVSQSIKTMTPTANEIPSSKTTSYKVEESKNFTVAPAYNKGAYQVIPRGDVEWIGK